MVGKAYFAVACFEEVCITVGFDILRFGFGAVGPTDNDGFAAVKNQWAYKSAHKSITSLFSEIIAPGD